MTVCRKVCRIVYRSGVVEALSSTPDLPLVTALLAVTGAVVARRASDVAEDAAGWWATVRPWVSGSAVPLGPFATRAVALAAEVDYLNAALQLEGRAR